jgi:hypothetical protein
MWVLFRKTSSAIVAEAWYEFCEDSGVPCRIWWSDATRRGDLSAPCEVYVPNDRAHVAEMLAKNC